MNARSPNPHTALQQVLIAGLNPASVMIETERQTPWSSATFSGTRHYFDMTVSGNDAIAAAANLGTMISEDRVAIDGHIIADIMLSSHQLIQSCQSPMVVLGIEALTVRD
jgi:hypothetical protein